MSIGIFTTAYGKYNIKETVERLTDKGIRNIQLNLQFENKSILPSELTEDQYKEIKENFHNSNITINSIAGYTNLVNPDIKAREKGIEELKKLISISNLLGSNVVVTEVGSTNPQNGWIDHPNNHTRETWNSLVKTIKDLGEYASKYNVILAIEPHFGQVVNTAEKLKILLEEVNLPNIKVIADIANLITPDNVENIDKVIEDFFEKVGDQIVLAHAKDANIKDERTILIGLTKSGVLNHKLYLELLSKYNYTGPIILEFISEEEIDEAKEILEVNKVPPFLRTIYQNDRELYDLVKKSYDSVHTDGALEKKYKLLISMVVDAIKVHPEGVIACANEARQAGATEDQINEALRISFLGGGLPALLEGVKGYKN